MTYGELFTIWLKRILIALLIICIIGMALSAVVKARRSVRASDAVIARADYLLEKYGR